MRNFDGFVFDVDGTLVSSNELIFATFNHIAEKHLSRSYSNSEIIGFFGPPEDVILKDLLKDKYDSARDDYYNYYRENHKQMADIFPGMIEILNAIKRENIPLAIYTGKGRRSAIITLEAIGILDYFDLIVSGDDVKEHKPSPEGIEIFINKFGLKRERVLMIGDAPADIIAARSAGVKSAAVLWDCYAPDSVKALNGDYYVNSVAELKELILSNI